MSNSAIEHNTRVMTKKFIGFFFFFFFVVREPAKACVIESSLIRAVCCPVMSNSLGPHGL